MKTDNFSLKIVFIYCLAAGLYIQILSWSAFPRIGEYWTSYICDGFLLLNYGQPKILAACRNKNTNEVHSVTFLFILLLSGVSSIYSITIFLLVLATKKLTARSN
jgi:hypothetical protein